MEDFTAVQSILSDRCRWLAQRRITQWPASGFEIKVIQAGVEDESTYLVRVGKEIVGTFVLMEFDSLWGDFPGSAFYVRRMATHSSWGGRDIGGAILSWIGQQANSDARSFVRLSAPINDGSLVKYLARNEFVSRAEVDAGGVLTELMERPAEA